MVFFEKNLLCAVIQDLNPWTCSKMKIVSMPGDGRCMYHSVAYHLKSDVRLVMNRLYDFYTLFGHSRVHESEKETWADWIRMEFNQSLDEYKRGLFRRWGGTLDLLALARIFGRTIIVSMPHAKDIVIDHHQQCKFKNSNPITIHYNGYNH